MMKIEKVVLLLLWIVFCGSSLVAMDLFHAENNNDLSLDGKLLEEKSDGKLTFKRFFFTSQRDGGETFRIYAVYATPAKPGKYPAILHIHGGGQTADQELVKRWAARGYACLSFDWTGNPERKFTGKREFSSFGQMTELKSDDAVFPEAIETSRVHQVQVAARRALLWLSEQPEVDFERLGVTGISWGGFNVLLLGETVPGIKAVVDIYGTGYFDRPYCLTGPLVFRSPASQQAWLSAYDPSIRIKEMKVPVLLLSGSNDMFFPLKQLMQTFESLPTAKRLILVPNVNHSLSMDFIECQAQIWFDHYLKQQPPDLPEIATSTVSAQTIKGRIELNGQRLKSVSVNYTWSKEPLQSGVKSLWQTRRAELLKDNFMAELPQIAPDKELQWLNYYLYVVTESGAACSSKVNSVKIETVAAPVENTVADVNNYFADSSLEKQNNRGFSGKVFFNYTGEYVYDNSGKYARTGKAAVHLSGKNQLMMEAKEIKPGATYVLSAWFKGAESTSTANLRINWLKSGKFIKTDLFMGKAGADAYQQQTLKSTAPEGATTAILFFSANDAWIDDLSFAPVSAENGK